MYFNDDDFVALARSMAAVELLELRLDGTNFMQLALRRVGEVARHLVLLCIGEAVGLATVLDQKGVLFPCMQEPSAKSWGNHTR